MNKSTNSRERFENDLENGRKGEKFIIRELLQHTETCLYPLTTEQNKAWHSDI